MRREALRTSLPVALAVFILVVLSVLQYRWLGELSVLQRAQMERTLEASTEGLARELSQEFRRMESTFRFGFRPAEPELARGYREWLRSPEFSGLILGLYRVEVGNGQTGEGERLRIREASLDSDSLVDVEWPVRLLGVRQKLIDLTASRQNNPGDEFESFAESLDHDALAFVISRDFPIWTVVLLEPEVLVGQFIPAVVQNYFGTGEERDYHVWVVDESTERIIYASPDTVPSEMSSADVLRKLDYGPNWFVYARHRLGSLGTVVGEYRLSNLSLSFGILLLLGTSVLFLVLATSRAQRLARRQMEFVAGVSHELRTPIAGISSLSENLADGVVGDLEQAKSYGKAIHKQSNRLKEMVDKVLHFSAIRSDEYHYEFHDVDLAQIVQKEIEVFERSSEGNVQLKVDLDDNLPPVCGDADTLGTVVRNLISNALKFGKEGLPVVVSTRVGERRGAKEIELSVQDQGEGIAPSDLPHVFKPFYRGKAASSAQVGGSGLGLSLVREIVDAHGGRVEVASALGAGSKFSVHLPTVDLEQTNGARE